jgi:hypothetical protein
MASNRDNVGMTKEIIRKISVGDGLTDAELDTALKFYQGLARDLSILGPYFHFPWVECQRTTDALEGFRRSRERKS